MNTVLSRANAVFAFCLTVLATLTFLCFLSTLLNANMSSVELAERRVVVKNVPDFTEDNDRNDLGLVTFDMRTDLTNVFNWNVKQLFIYLVAEYKTRNNALNQVVLWDKIVMRDENYALDLNDEATKYYFFDDGTGLKGNKNVSLTLYWNVVPNAGRLLDVTVGSHRFEFPDRYVTGRA